MLRTIIFLIFMCTLGCAKIDESSTASIKSFGFSEIPESSLVEPPLAEFDTSDHIIQPKHLKKYYDQPGELGYIAEGANYGFESLSVIMAMAMPGGVPPLHTHDIKELHIVYDGTIEYMINEKTLIAHGPYIIKIPAGAHHTFINRGETPAKVVGILSQNNKSYQELGPNPLLEN